MKLIGGENKALGFGGYRGALGGGVPDAGVRCFYRKERVGAATHTSMREDASDIWHNDQWRMVGLLTILNILAVCVRGGAMMYYVTDGRRKPGVFVAFLTTYCVGNLIGSAL